MGRLDVGREGQEYSLHNYSCSFPFERLNLSLNWIKSLNLKSFLTISRLVLDENECLTASWCKEVLTLGWPWTQHVVEDGIALKSQSSCRYLLGAGIIGTSNYAELKKKLFFNFYFLGVYLPCVLEIAQSSFTWFIIFVLDGQS